MFRFTIRELVLLTVIVAMGVAWWLDRSDVERRGNARAAAIRAHAEVLQVALKKARPFPKPFTFLDRANAASVNPIRRRSVNYLPLRSADVDWSLADKPIPR